MKSLKTVLFSLIFAITLFICSVPCSVTAQTVPSVIEVGKMYTIRSGGDAVRGKIIKIDKDGWVIMEKESGFGYVWINIKNAFLIYPEEISKNFLQQKP
jgi:hypothetical protein